MLIVNKQKSHWGALWSEGVIGWGTAQYVSKSGRKVTQNNQHFAWRSFKWCNVSHIMPTFKLYNKKEISRKKYFMFYLRLLLKQRSGLPYSCKYTIKISWKF